jgi:hypothetical protein
MTLSASSFVHLRSFFVLPRDKFVVARFIGAYIKISGMAQKGEIIKVNHKNSRMKNILTINSLFIPVGIMADAKNI